MENTNQAKRQMKDYITIVSEGIIKTSPRKKEITDSEGKPLELWETRVGIENEKCAVIVSIYTRDEPDVNRGDIIPIEINTNVYKVRFGK